MKAMRSWAVFAAGSLVTSALMAGPVRYWYVGGDSSFQSDKFLLDDATDVSWQDGNIICLVDGTASMTTQIKQSGKTSANSGSFTYQAGQDSLKAAGFYSHHGLRYWTFNSLLELGAKGIEQGAGAWDWMAFSGAGGIKLTESQTWRIHTGIDCGLWQPWSAVKGVALTLKPTTSPNRGGGDKGVMFRSSTSNLSGADVIVDGAWLVLADPSAKIKASRVVLADSGALKQSRLYVYEGMASSVSRSFAGEIVLRDSVPLELYEYTSKKSYASSIGTPGERKASLTIDVDKITVETGTSMIGDGYEYAIANAGTQVIDVKEGAAVRLMKLPTSGRIKIAGKGTVFVPNGFADVDYDVDFSGKVGFVDKNFRLTDVSGFSYGLHLSGTSVVALPATSTWPENFNVSLEGDARLILPIGKAVDATKIAGSNYAANGWGYETVGSDVTVNAGETLVIIGDGFSAATSLTLAGGTVEFPVSATVASPVMVSAPSTLKSSGIGVEGVFTGTVVADGKVTIDNAVKDTASIDVTKWPVGTMVFAGGGTVRAGGLVVNSGALELRGGKWSIAAGVECFLTNKGIMMKVSDGALVRLADGTDASRAGLRTSNGGSYPAAFYVCGKAVLTVGDYRMIRLGDQSWQGTGQLVVDDATVNIVGNGEFDNGGPADENLNNTNADRVPMAVVTVRNGGKLVTDRVFAHTTATHKFQGDDVSYLDDWYDEGTRLVLDGGSYCLGAGFGHFSEDGVTPVEFPNQHPNQLFSHEGIQSVGMNVGLTFTSEITVRIGENGGTFDLSGARAGNVSFTNTVLDSQIRVPTGAKTKPGFAGMDYMPCRGPRWQINGPLVVKGRGDQEFVLNGIDPADLKKMCADGAVARIIDTNGVASVALPEVALGAAGAGVSVENAEGEACTLSIDKVIVDGIYDAGCFNVGSTTIGDVVFNAGAGIAATPGQDKAPLLLPVTGTATFVDPMRYSIPRGNALAGTLFRADGGIVAPSERDVSWLPASGAKERFLKVVGNTVQYTSKGLVLTIR